MVIDKDRIENKLYYIKQNLNKLYQLRDLSEGEFTGDYKNYDAAKYNLQVIIEALIDIGNHIISRKHYRVPESNADTFRILKENGVIPEDKVANYIAMARFRNMVVHLYEEIDVKELYAILNKNLIDFEYLIDVIVNKFLN